MSEACAKHPSVFHHFYIRLIRVGEETGNMETVLRSLVKQMKKDEALKAKIKKGMSYPAFIGALGGGVVLMLLLFVMPTMEKIYTSNNMDVPTILAVSIGLGDFIKSGLARLPLPNSLEAIWTGVLLSLALAFVIDSLLRGLGRVTTPRTKKA